MRFLPALADVDEGRELMADAAELGLDRRAASRNR
jgi:hypothetical protein